VADYPRWSYYPTRDPPPDWVAELVGVVSTAKPEIDSANVSGLTSDTVLARLRAGLERIGFQVESGKKVADRITLPVLFGEQGAPRVRYDVDGVHRDLGVLLEVEAGRGARGNAVYRDLVRTSLIVDAEYLALCVMQANHHQSGGKSIVVRSYADSKDQLDAIYASQRLQLPFKGVLLFGY
jgi:hypothetical protein